jgi:hydroxymethylbilane synthase
MLHLRKFKVGSRGSPLARAQVEIFSNILEKSLGKNFIIELEKKFYQTSGDNFFEKKISTIGNKGLFTKEIDDAQLNLEIDIAVHSLKDLPTKLPKGLIIGAVLKREDPLDVILFNKKKKFKSLSKGAVVGTSSLRRSVQLKKLRPDLNIKDIRGNVETRIKKLKKGNFDAIILAAAGLKRLGIDEHYEKLNIGFMTPSPGQGVIALVVRENDKNLGFLKKVNDPSSFIESECERIYLSALDGSCETPVGALAKIKLIKKKKKIHFNYMASSPDGFKYFKDQTYFDIDNYRKMSFNLGYRIKKLL